MTLTGTDMELLKQLPLVGLFLLVVFRMNKDHRDYLTDRDKLFAASLDALSVSLKGMSDRVHNLGLALVTLASESDHEKAVSAAKRVMQDFQKPGA